MKPLFKSFFIPGTMWSVLGLGITTTVGYGTLYYSITIMSEELFNAFGWSKSFIFGILSLGILLGGFIAPMVGKFLDKHGARGIMSIGSILCAVGLFGLSTIETKFDYVIAILFLETVSVFVLYEAAFVAFSQLAGVKARLPIIQITLMAGFASTIFWPLITFLLTIVSWREVYQILGLFHIVIALPIHYFVLKSHLKISNSDFEEDALDETIELEGKIKQRTLILLSIAFSLIAIPITAMQTQFLAIFKGFGMDAATAVGLGAMIGVYQVVARVI
ncbi:MAG: MFS transporter, partial [Campylobacterales bacterium]|nr:MFS transporter [Campylobacterales bacterium]